MRRHKPFIYWIKGKNNNVSFSELIRFTFSLPFKQLGKNKVKSVVAEGNYYKVQFEGFLQPIYWPKDFPLYSLYQVAAELLYRNWWNYEINENKVEEGAVVIDCGAAEGGFAMQVANRCKKVYAIEPHPRFVEAMKKAFFNINNVEILPLGVGDKITNMRRLDDGIMSKIDNDKGIQVEINTIDNLFYIKNIKVNFIKADLEGFELSMLRGAENTIKTWKPKLSITTYHNQDDYKNISDYIKQICPEYIIKGVGITDSFGTPVMLHAWVK